MSDDLPVPSPAEPEPPDKSEDGVQSSASQRRMNNLDNNQDNNQSPSSMDLSGGSGSTGDGTGRSSDIFSFN